jgi:sialidase-1
MLKILLLLLFSLALPAQDISFTQPNLPLRIDRQHNLLGHLKIKAGTKLTELVINAEGSTDLADIIEISVHDTGAKAPSSIGERNKTIVKTTGISSRNVLKFNYSPEKDSYIALSCRLKANTNLLHRFSLSVSEAVINGENVKVHQKNTHILRPAVKVRHKGDDNSKGYRIPGMVTTNNGSLLACYDVRYESMRDLQGHMDIGISRSTDKGQTWEPMRISIDMGEYGGLPQKFNGVSDACLVVNPKTGRIFCFGLWMHGVTDKKGNWLGAKGWIHQWNYNGSLQGFDIKGTSQFLMSYSDDDGKSWSKPENLTKTVKRNEKWFLFAPAPGNGICMKNGTLVVPVQGRNEHRGEFSTIMYSKDDGKTWETGLPANDTTKKDFANECAVVELNDGSLMLNARDPSRSKKRGVFITKNLGETWTHHETHRQIIEPTCMASLIRHSVEVNSKPLFIFSNPHSTTKRNHMTIQVSQDQGKSWIKKTLVDEFSSAGYSSLSSIDKDTIGIFYESSQAMLLFQKFTIEELMK